MTCKNCGNAMPDPHPNRRYCSKECRLTHYRATSPTCSIDGCLGVTVGRGLCGTHYARERVAGRYTSKVCKADGCGRALLCHHCNIGLGHFRDDREALGRAIDYLTEHAPVNRSIS